MDEANTTLRVEARMIGKRKLPGAPWQLTLSPTLLRANAETRQVLLLRDLIAALVRAEVQASRLATTKSKIPASWNRFCERRLREQRSQTPLLLWGECLIVAKVTHHGYMLL